MIKLCDICHRRIDGENQFGYTITYRMSDNRLGRFCNACPECADLLKDAFDEFLYHLDELEGKRMETVAFEQYKQDMIRDKISLDEMLRGL